MVGAPFFYMLFCFLFMVRNILSKISGIFLSNVTSFLRNFPKRKSLSVYLMHHSHVEKLRFYMRSPPSLQKKEGEKRRVRDEYYPQQSIKAISDFQILCTYLVIVF